MALTSPASASCWAASPPATAAGLYALILVFGPVSGAHFDPVISLAVAGFGRLPWETAAWTGTSPTRPAGRSTR